MCSSTGRYGKFLGVMDKRQLFKYYISEEGYCYTYEYLRPLFLLMESFKRPFRGVAQPQTTEVEVVAKT
jgi:hypothetical protein